MNTKNGVAIVGKIRTVACKIECMRRAFGADAKVADVIKILNNNK